MHFVLNVFLCSLIAFALFASIWLVIVSNPYQTTPPSDVNRPPNYICTKHLGVDKDGGQTLTTTCSYD